MTKELSKTLTLALVNYLDENRPEGTMDCSSGECVSLEKAFTEEDFDRVEAFIQKKLSRLTEFEQGIRDMIVNALTTVHKSSNGQITSSVVMDYNTTHLLAAGILDLAKKELARRDEVITLDNLPPYDKGFQDGKAEAMADLERTFECNPDKLPGWLKDELNKAFKKGQESSHEDYVKGYANGYKDAEKRYNESVAYHFPTIPTRPICWEPGGTCTNPQMDCINCPRKATGGTFTSPNTASGTSTATLHGNTSFTDGKEHNPSFTD